jgi:hypothetical protein
LHTLLKRASALLVAVGTALTLAAAPVSAASSGYWNRTEAGWRYLIDDKPVTGRFQYVDGKWYNFDQDGLMRTGWYNLPNSSIWYYFKEDGSAVIGDWVKVNGTWYYMDSAGYMVTGWQKINETWYYFMDYGGLKTGWIQRGVKWYYVTPGGVYKTGWQLSGGRWYYLQMDGTMAAECTLTIGGVTYSFDMNGIWWVVTPEEEEAGEESEITSLPEEPEDQQPEPEEQQPSQTAVEQLSEAMVSAVSASCTKRTAPDQAVTAGYLQSTLMLDRLLVKDFSGVMNEKGSVLYLALEAQPGKMNDLLTQINIARKTLVLGKKSLQTKIWSNGSYLALILLDSSCKDAAGELEIAAAAFDAAAQQLE